jgi:hypothetical protein
MMYLWNFLMHGQRWEPPAAVKNQTLLQRGLVRSPITIPVRDHLGEVCSADAALALHGAPARERR